MDQQEIQNLLQALKIAEEQDRIPAEQLNQIPKVRNVLRKWNGQDAIPELNVLRDWGLLPEACEAPAGVVEEEAAAEPVEEVSTPLAAQSAEEANSEAALPLEPQEAPQNDESERVTPGSDEEPPAPLFNAEQAAELLARLKDAIRKAAVEDSERMDDIFSLRKPIQDWLAGGQVGELPGAADLWAWGIWPPVEPQTEFVPEIGSPANPVLEEPRPPIEAQDAEPAPDVPTAVEPQEVEPSLTAPDVEEPVADEPVENAIPLRVETRPVLVQPLRTEVEKEALPVSDEALRSEFNAAQDLFKRGRHHEAFKKLSELDKLTQDTLKQPVDDLLVQTQVLLEKGTAELITKARQAVEAAPNDLKRIEKAWNNVLSYNPDAVEAGTGLAEIERRREVLRITQDLDRIEKDIRYANEHNDWRVINRARGEAETFYQLSEDGRLPDELVIRARQIRRHVDEARAKISKELGIIATALSQGDYRLAYISSREAFEKNRDTILDITGEVGGKEGELVETPKFFAYATNKYLASLRSVADGRVEKAKAESVQEPELARKTLLGARALLIDEILLEDHRQRMADLVAQLDERLEVIERRIQALASARQKIIDARTEGIPIKDRIRLLNEARELFPDYPGFAEIYDQALVDFQNYLVSQLETVTAEAEQEIARDRYEEAIQRLRGVLDQVRGEFPTLVEGSSLELKVHEVTERLREIRALHNDFSEMENLVRQGEEALRIYKEANDNRQLVIAREIYKKLEERQKERHSLVETFHVNLLAEQGDVITWEEGTNYYYNQRWELARQTLSKISPSYAHYAEATVMVHRARAAWAKEDALRAYNEQNYGAAIHAINEAVSLFYGNPATGIQGYGTDGYTDTIGREAQEFLEQLKPIEENDRIVNNGLESARQQMKALRDMIASRQEPDSKTDRIPEIEQVCHLLEGLRSRPSTRSAEVSNLLAEAHKLWRTAYLAGMQTVAEMNSPGKKLVQKACDLATELEANALLYGDQEKVWELHLQTRHLDLDFDDWFPTGIEHVLQDNEKMPGWDLVEENRRQRFKHANTLNKLLDRCPSKTIQKDSLEELQTNLQLVSRKRVYAEVHRLRKDGADPKEARSDNLKGALDYLEKQLDSSGYLSADTTLIEMLIRLCWESGDWPKAEAAAVRFTNGVQIVDGLARKTFWQEMTHAAESFSRDQLEQGKSYFMELAKHDKYVLYQDLICRVQEDLERDLFNRLLHDAQSAVGKGSDEDFLKATEKFKLAHDLNPENEVVRVGLEQISHQLNTILPARCEQAAAAKIGTRTLTDAIRHAQGIHKTLSSVLAVVDLLKLDPDLVDTVTTAEESLRKKIQRWIEFNTQAERLDQSIADTLPNPNPFDDLEDNAGGWNFADAEDALLQMQTIGSRKGDGELNQIFSERNNRLEALVKAGNEIAQLAQTLMEKVHSEDFDQVIEAAKTLETRWNVERSRDRRWDGLHHLIFTNYAPWVNREATLPRDHRDIAIKQRDNFNAWAQWSGQTLKTYTETRASGRQINKELAKLREEMSLKEIVELSHKVIQQGTMFRQLVESRPATEPWSQKAELEKNRISDEMLPELERLARSSLIIKQEAEEALRRFTADNGPLQMLRRSVTTVKNLNGSKKNVPETVLAMLEEKINRCREYDPMHEEVMRAQTLLAQLRGGGDYL